MFNSNFLSKMTKSRFNLRSVAKIGVASLAVITVFLGCDKDPDPIDNPSPKEAIELKSPITENTTLKDLGLPIDYFYNGDVLLEVKNGAILTIEDSVTIQFRKAGGGIQVMDGATIKALGTPSKRIQFIGTGTSKGSWEQLRIQSSTDNQFAYCDFINGGKSANINSGTFGVLQLFNAKVGIQHCTISGGLGTGIYNYDDSGKPSTQFTAFNNNVIEGFESFAPVTIGSCNEVLSLIEKFDMTSNFANNTIKYIQLNSLPYTSKNTSLNKTTVPYYFSAGMEQMNFVWTINKGVIIYVATDKHFCNRSGNGSILINGTADEKVRITRLPGTTGYWGRMHFDGLKGSEFNHCIFEYGGLDGGGWYGMLNMHNTTDLKLNNVEINNSYNYGVHLTGCSSYRLQHSNVTFKDNEKGNVWNACLSTPAVQPDLP